MTDSEINKMQKFEKTYWWHIGKKNLIVDLMKQYVKEQNTQILEIGCGSGEITKNLTQFGQVHANDISSKALEITKTKGIKNTILGNINDIETESYKNKFDVILTLDVLEHIQDDRKTINKINEMLKPNGLLIVTVPAYKFLWSCHDEALEHKRRYTSYEIKTKLQDQKFKVIKQSYSAFFVFPVIAAFKVLSNFIGKSAYPKTSYIMLPDKINGFLVKLLSLESKLIKHICLPFGTTIVLVAKKEPGFTRTG